MAGSAADTDVLEGDLSASWIHGSRHPRHRTDPPLQVHMYDEGTAIIRESKDVSFEAPFLYLLFGEDRALLLDTGATASPERFPLRKTTDALIGAWLSKHPKEGYALVVAHTHGHGDHVAGDPQFAGRAETTVIAKDLDSVKSFFGFSGWPEGRGSCDLGGRTLELIPGPGHHPTAVAVYDPRTGFLITGDTVYPGRLYAFDFPAFVATLDRLARFAAERPVSHVMGCHIEMTRVPRKDYPATTKYQPDEPPLQMTVSQLASVRDAALSVKDKPGAHYFDDFAIYNGQCTGAVTKQLIRAALRNLARSVLL